MDKVVHFEIPYNDKERVKEFYGKVFGWQMQDFPEMDYTITRSVEVDEDQTPKESGAINGGFYKRDESMAKTPVIIIEVPSINEYIKKIKSAGCSVFKEKSQIGDMGFYAQVKDTEGNVIGIWEIIKKY